MVIMELLYLWYRTRTPLMTGYVQFLINWNWHLEKIICTVDRFSQCKVLNSSKAAACSLQEEHRLMPALADGKHLAACTEHAAWHEAIPRNRVSLPFPLVFLARPRLPVPQGCTHCFNCIASLLQSECLQWDGFTTLVHPFLGRPAKLKSELLRKFQDHTCKDNWDWT